jgi:Uma2 family endonuclease
VEPRPRDPEALDSLRLWVPDTVPPTLAVEVVSKSHPYKDYALVPDQCASIGVRELIVFDPLLAGSRKHGGPHRLQIWRRTEDDAFERVYAGPGPVRSEVLQAFCVVTDEPRLRFADDAGGRHLWPTPEEAERLEKERRIAELEAELARRR